MLEESWRKRGVTSAMTKLAISDKQAHLTPLSTTYSVVRTTYNDLSFY